MVDSKKGLFEFLLDFSLTLQRSLTIEALSQAVLSEIKDYFSIENTMLYIKKPFTENYQMIDCYGFDKNELEKQGLFSIHSSNDWIRYINNQKKAFVYEPAIQPLFSSFPVKIFIPLYFKDKLLGFLILGNRENNYTEEDFFVFEKIAPMIAQALENAFAHLYANRNRETGLYDFTYFQKRLKEEIYQFTRYGTVFSLILLDVDNFQKIIAEKGVEASQSILSQIAEIIFKNIRESDIACKVKEDEYAVLLPITAEQGGVFFAERLRKKIEENSFQLPDGSTLSLTVSFGITEYQKDFDFESLIENTKKALLLAKEAGKNQAVSFSDYLREKE